jgi:hypothetical protein
MTTHRPYLMEVDFEQLAFIEKWRRRATRGTIVALDATRGHTVLTMRAGELGQVLDLSGRDETGAVRKQRLTIGDRIFAAFRYTVAGVAPAAGSHATRAVAKGADIQGTFSGGGEMTQVDIDGVAVIVEGDQALAGLTEGTVIRCRVTDEGRAYVIPTR